MNVTSANYVGLAVRTDNAYEESMLVRLNNPAFIKNLHHLMRVASSIGELADVNKRYMFYGVPVYAENSTSTVDKTLSQFADDSLIARIQDKQFVRLLHSVIGIITEMGELIDILFACLFEGQEIDFKHIQEEYGDTFWYAALGLDAIGAQMESVLLANIMKLAARYPDGFKEFDAVNRNLTAERAVLEHHLEPNGITVNDIEEYTAISLETAIAETKMLTAIGSDALGVTAHGRNAQLNAWLVELAAYRNGEIK
jgi:hypothetical protein